MLPMPSVLPMPPPTPYKISTITAVGGVGSSVDLPCLFAAVPIGGEHGVLRAVLEGLVRGADVKQPKKKRTKKDKKFDLCGGECCASDGIDSSKSLFANQVTLLLDVEGTSVNAKVFCNGRVQLTGVKRIEHGALAVERLADLARPFARSPDQVRASGYRVCLINSDLDLGYRVRRDLFHRTLRESFPRLSCAYDPCTYPGVRIKFYWNACNGEAQDGVCRCGDDRRRQQNHSCADGRGRGDGDGPGRCRKVTLSVFQSGKVIIVGAHTEQQLAAAYRFLVDSIAVPLRERFYLPPVAKAPAPAVAKAVAKAATKAVTKAKAAANAPAKAPLLACFPNGSIDYADVTCH